MFNYEDFDEVFGFDTSCSYSDDNIAEITRNKAKLEGLFIEKVMKLSGIKRPTKFYPPKTNGDLRLLHEAVIDSNAEDHHKLSILYYILLQFDQDNGDRVLSNDFQGRSFLPNKYCTYMKGLFHLDRLEFELALQYLTHPSLTPQFADEIIEVLVRTSQKQDLTLALAYYHTVQPTLTSKAALEHLFSAIGRTSVTEAFYFSRGQTDFTRRHFFEMLISLVLNNSTPETVADRGVELVGLPFDAEEEAWFEEYLDRGEGRVLKKAKDTLITRKIGTARFNEGLLMRSRNSSRAIGGLDWGNLSAGVQNGLGPRVSLG